MSKLPKFGQGGKPQMNTTTQSTSRDPRTGAIRTTTKTNVTELRPCGESSSRQPTSAGPSLSRLARSAGAGISRLPAPNANSTMIAPGISRLPAPNANSTMIARPQQVSMPRPNAESTRIAPQPMSSTTREYFPCQNRGHAPQPGQYAVPAQFGPQTLKGKGVTYSSPLNLRGQMEARIPKDLKFFANQPPPGLPGRGVLEGSRLDDTFSGAFNVYGGGRPEDLRTPQDNSLLNQTADANELLNLSSPDVAAVEHHVEQDLLEMYSQKKSKVYAKGRDMHKVPEEVIQTPAGIEPVIQQTYTEKRVERDGEQERVIKNVSVTQFGTRVTLSEQQIDPNYGIPGGHGRDVVTVKETVAITQSYKATAKDVVHESSKGKVMIDTEELANLIAEENEDVENTLKMAPPDLTLSPERYTMKKRLQKLRLNSESMVLLEQSMINPASTADDAMVETPPEAFVNIMHTVEAGVAPQCAPDQIFNTLFEEKGPQHSVQLSSVGPGPLQDVVVPHEITKDIHKEAMTADLNKLTEKMKNAPNVEEIPYMDIFTRLMDDEAKKTIKKVPGTKKSFKPVGEEEMPWGNEDIEPMVNIVGAEPVEILDPLNIEDLEQSGKLQEELANGMEYFVDADPVQYMSRVQLRGSHPPSWFPGYIYALPEFQNVVKVARCPDEVFYASWKSVQPRIFPDQDISILA